MAIGLWIPADSGERVGLHLLLGGFPKRQIVDHSGKREAGRGWPWAWTTRAHVVTFNQSQRLFPTSKPWHWHSRDKFWAHSGPWEVPQKQPIRGHTRSQHLRQDWSSLLTHQQNQDNVCCLISFWQFLKVTTVHEAALRSSSLIGINEFQKLSQSSDWCKKYKVADLHLFWHTNDTFLGFKVKKKKKALKRSPRHWSGTYW